MERKNKSKISAKVHSIDQNRLQFVGGFFFGVFFHLGSFMDAIFWYFWKRNSFIRSAFD